MKRPFPILFITIFLVTACSTQSKTSSIPVTPTATQTPPPASTLTLLPTASSLRDSVLWNNLQVAIDRLEITNEYTTDFGSLRTPPNGKKFFWVHVRLKNTNQVEMDTPVFEHYSILYAAVEVKPSYGYRQGYTEYTALNSTIFPDQELDGWLRFDIPDTAELKDLRFVFLPESSGVGTSFSSPNYPYSDDKPTYVWDCAR